MSSIKKRAENLVEFAKYTNDNDLDNVVKEIVTLVQEQRLELLTEVLQLIKRGASEAIIEERQRQEAAKLSKRQTLWLFPYPKTGWRENSCNGRVWWRHYSLPSSKGFNTV